MTAPWVPGEVITRREVLHGRLWLEHPVTVVDDDGTTFAVLLEPGSPFTFHDHPIGPHPWGAHEAWGGTTVLQVHRTGERYGAWKFFDETPAGPRFRYWYLNFESPIVRDDDGYDTDDHGLDLIVHPDGRREWKDVEHLHVAAGPGPHRPRDRGCGPRGRRPVVDLLDADDRWWSGVRRLAPEA